MTISRGQMKRQLYMSGGIMDVVPREQALLGGIKKAVKKVSKGVKDFAKSDLGKAALIGAAAFGIPGTSIGGLFGRASFMVPGGQAVPGVFGFGGIGNALAAGKAKLFPQLSISDSMLNQTTRDLATKTGLSKGTLATLGIGAASVLAGLSAEEREEIDAAPAEDRGPIVAEKLRQSLTRLGVKGEELDRRVAEGVSEYFSGAGAYAVGGRVGFAEGPVLPPDSTQPVNPFGPKPGDFGIEEDISIKMASNIENDRILEALFEKYLDLGFSPKEAEDKAKEEFDRMSMMKTEERGLAALGGKMDTASDNAMQAGGIEGLPVRENQKGVKELDLRKTGGFIPPVGIKEKADDIPAMLSNNEFVFTADAVRAAGDGDVNKGAQRMYDTMKKLENKVVRV